MLAVFVQVEPARLAEIIDDPSRVTEILDGGETVGGLVKGPLARTGPLGEMTELLQRTPKILEASMAMMDPAMRQRLKERLSAAGINTDAMTAGGKDADALLKLMRERGQALAAKLGLQQSAQPPVGSGKASQGAKISLDKAWHGVHYLLCGNIEPGSTIPSQAVMGGVELGEDLGYGPARYFETSKVNQIAQALNAASLEAEMIARFDPAKMTSLEIYPGGWKAGDVDWLMEEFRRLRQFYDDASAAKLAIVTNLE
jgi:Domain of unknown function (DUF1877)